MTSPLAHPKNTLPRPLLSSLLGIVLLLPASFFMLAMLARIFLGVRSPYYFIAPSFLQHPFDPLAWHKAQFILGCLLLAIGLNCAAVLRIHIAGTQVQLSLRRSWLNMAIALQGLLMLIILAAYTLVQHIRY